MNINNLKRFVKQNKVVGTIARIACTPLFAIAYMQADMGAIKRRKGYVDKEFEWIKEYKNKFIGQRCFVIATGPSLTMEDLDKIKNEYSFSMNNISKAYDRTSWRPKFCMVQDEYVYETFEKELERQFEDDDSVTIIVSNSIHKKFKSARKYKSVPVHFLDHKIYRKKGYGQVKFSKDCYSIIYDANSVVFSVLQLACYMGFKEIYLLGCDCNYLQEKHNFSEYDLKDNSIDYASAGNKLISSHYKFKKFADSLGVKVVNCTRGGMLEVYPRMNLDEVIKI
jgi:hypothetical protein